TIFTDGYNAVADGIAAGILARKGEVYFANVPSLYLLKDTKNGGYADSTNVLATGFGVHYQLPGHDLHCPLLGLGGRSFYSRGAVAGGEFVAHRSGTPGGVVPAAGGLCGAGPFGHCVLSRHGIGRSVQRSLLHVRFPRRDEQRRLDGAIQAQGSLVRGGGEEA